MTGNFLKREDMQKCEAALVEAMSILEAFHIQTSLKKLRTQVAEKRPVLNLALKILMITRKARITLSIMLWFAILFYPKKWFSIEQRDVYCVSLTANNAKSLSSVQDCFEKPEEGFQLNAQPISISTRLLLFRKCWCLAPYLQKQGADQDFIYLHQLLSAVGVILFFHNITQTEPKLVMAANDHSPATVALFSVAKQLDVKTCYVQHGFITESFPPLRYDLAILHNRISLARYLTVAGENGISTDVSFLPDKSDKAVAIRSIQSVRNICIALSDFVDLDALQDLVITLLNNYAIDKISISQHPRCLAPLTTFFSDTRVEILPRHFAKAYVAQNHDICLVTNSSVALEFLHFGCPTCYVNPWDLSQDDYYGFVRSGILPRFELTYLKDTGRINAFFDANWKEIFAEYDPTTNVTLSHLQSEVREKIQALLSG